MALFVTCKAHGRRARDEARHTLKPLRLSLLAALLLSSGSVSRLAYAQLIGGAAEPIILGGTDGLKIVPQLQEHHLQPHDGAALFASGAQLRGSADKQLEIQGHAELRQDKSVITATDRLHYDADTDQVDAYGNVHLVSDGNTFSGPEAHLVIDALQGMMLMPHFHFMVNGGFGHASRVELRGPEIARMSRVYYSACPCAAEEPQKNGSKPNLAPKDAAPEHAAWYIKASKLEINREANTGTARNAIVFFQHVPIFASPYLSFPTNSSRHSGFLPPIYGIARLVSVHGTDVQLASHTTLINSLDITLPYYWDIAPNRDLTLYPRYLGKHGFQFGGLFRYLSPTYSGSISLELLPDDYVTRTNRYAIAIQHNQQLGKGWNAYVNYNQVSDGDYSQDFTSRTSPFLVQPLTFISQQEAGVTYNNGPWSILARVQHWQVLPQGRATAPAQSEPQINVKYVQYDRKGFDYGFESEATHYETTNTTQTQRVGLRAFLNSYVSYPIVTPDYWVTPRAEGHLIAYQLSHASGGAGQRNNPAIAIPTVSLDSGTTFERPVTIFGTGYTQTLEPRLYYVYTPYVRQDDIPIFDTANVDFGMSEVFTPNTFIGNDRVADQSRTVLGLSSRFIDTASGMQRARFLLAQQYYFKPQTVTLTNTPNTNRSDRAEAILGAQFQWNTDLATETAAVYSNSRNLMTRFVTGLAWKPGDQRVLDLSYRYNRDDNTFDNQPINQGLIAGQWPLMRHLFGVARVSYDFTEKQIVDSMVGFQYDAPCWSFGVGLQRWYYTLASGLVAANNRVLAQLQLKGLSTVSNGLVQSFAAGIQGYQDLPPDPPPLSRFTNYPE